MVPPIRFAFKPPAQTTLASGLHKGEQHAPTKPASARNTRQRHYEKSSNLRQRWHRQIHHDSEHRRGPPGDGQEGDGGRLRPESRLDAAAAGRPGPSISSPSEPSPGRRSRGCMKADEPGRANALREPHAGAARSEGEGRPKSAFRGRLLRWLSCPELRKDFNPSTLPRPRTPKWPEPKGRAPMIGKARKVTVRSANDSCVVSFRIADYGLLREFSLRIWDYRISLTCDDLTSYTWLFPSRVKS